MCGRTRDAGDDAGGPRPGLHKRSSPPGQSRGGPAADNIEQDGEPGPSSSFDSSSMSAASVPYASSITHGPPLFPPPADIPGLPTLAEIRAFDVLFDWPTLKRFIREGCVSDKSSRQKVA